MENECWGGESWVEWNLRRVENAFRDQWGSELLCSGFAPAQLVGAALVVDTLSLQAQIGQSSKSAAKYVLQFAHGKPRSIAFGCPRRLDNVELPPWRQGWGIPTGLPISCSWQCVAI